MTRKTVEPYFPFGFQYPEGFAYNKANPDPAIEAIKERMKYLNKIYAMSGLPGHILAASLDLFQKESNFGPDVFWDGIRKKLTMTEVVEIANLLAPKVEKEPPRLEFPNAIPLFDCRFVSTKEWEHIRRYSIGGSEASTILKQSHFQSQRSLWHEKKTTFQEAEDIERQHIFDYGHDVEPYIISTVANRLGAVVYPEHRMFAHKQYPFITCNPDAIFLFSDGHKSLFEAKTAMWTKRKDWQEGIPEYYAPQPRHYLEVLNDDQLMDGYIGVCLGGMDDDIILHHYSRDAVAGKEQLEQEVAYWKNYIVGNKLPPFSGDAELDFQAAYTYVAPDMATSGNKDLPDTLLPDFQRYFDLQAEKKAIDEEVKRAKKEEDQLMFQIRMTAPDGMTVCSQPNEMSFVIKVKDSQRESVDMSKIALMYPEADQTLTYMAVKLKDSMQMWTTPKIKKQPIKK